MAKRILFFLGLIILSVGCAKVSEVENLQRQIDELKSDQIASINSQITSVNTFITNLVAMDNELRRSIETLQRQREELASSDEQLAERLDNAISLLQEKDREIQGKIKELKDYVDNEIQKLHDWATASFATLEKQADLILLVSGLQADLSTLQGTVTNLDNLISSLESSLKGWVNTQLTGYYTIAEINAKISRLESSIQQGDESLLRDIQTLRETLETAKSSLTSAYQQAILEAITENNGVINQKIATDIKEATDALQIQINALATRVSDMESRLGILEGTVEDILNKVQEINVIPTFSDGSVACTRGMNHFYFEVLPSGAAARLAEAGPDILSMKAVNTQTKAVASFTRMPISSVRAEEDILIIIASGSGFEATSEIYANACLNVTVGAISKSTGYFPLYFINSSSNETAVDLGLSVKWATCNLGENSFVSFPEEYGAHYAWGETVVKSDYLWTTYKYGDNETNLTRYNTQNENGIVDDSIQFSDYNYVDDVAREKLGGPWRIPTDAEWTELRSMCSWTWTILNGVNGILVEATNGNSIFLPATGEYSDELNNVDSFGDYWSSSLRVDNPSQAWGVHFDSIQFTQDSYYRCYGKSIRPVLAEDVTKATINEVNEGADESYYEVTGFVRHIEGNHYGNMYINDGTVDEPGLFIYGSRDKKGNKMKSTLPYDCFNSSHENSWTIGVGDKVTLYGTKNTYKGKVELVDVTIIEIIPSLLKAGKREFDVSKDGGLVKAGFVVKRGSIGFSTEDDWLHVSEILSDADSTYAKISVDPNPHAVPREGKITFSTSDGTNTFEIPVIVKQEPSTPELMTIAEALHAPYVHIKGRIMAICNGGYVLADETGAIFCFYGNTFDATQFKLGDEMEIISYISAYNYGPQLSCDGKAFDLCEKVSEGTGSVAYPTPTLIDQTALAALVVSISGKERDKVSDAITMEYVQITVTPKKVGSYTMPNLFLDDYTEADFCAYRLPSNFDLISMLDKKVTIRGYIQSIGGGKHVYIIFTEMIEV